MNCKLLALIAAGAALCSCGPADSPTVLPTEETTYETVYFRNGRTDGYLYHSNVRQEGASTVENVKGKIPLSEEESYSPDNSLRLSYFSAEEGNWEAEVQYEQLRGQENMLVPDCLKMLVKTENRENLPDVSFRMGNGTATEAVPMSKYIAGERDGWIQVSIPLGDLEGFDISFKSVENTEEVERSYRDLYKTAVVFSQGETKGSNTIYLDDIRMLKAEDPAAESLKAPEITEIEGFERHIDFRFTKLSDPAVDFYNVYSSTDGKDWKKIGLANRWDDRYTDYIGTTDTERSYRVSAVDFAGNECKLSKAVKCRTTGEMTDEQLMDMVQEAQFRFYWEANDPHSGLSLENTPGHDYMIATGASGFGMMTILVGVERGFVTRDQAADRFLRITDFLTKAEKHHGAFSHFMDGRTGKTVPFFGPRDNGGDLVETSFMTQGLLAARQYFNGENEKENTIRERIDSIWEGIEWDWYKRYPDSPFLYWHWSPDKEWIINHRLIGWNETMITYLLAIMSPTHAVEPEMYYTGWASPDEYAQEYRMAWSERPEGKNYWNGNTFFGVKLDVGVSNGGPLFFTHYSFQGFDPHALTDRWTNYFENNRNIAEINLRYCIANPQGYEGYGEDFWGLTACDGVWRYCAHEPMAHQDDGTIAPTGALASMPYTPEASLKAMKKMYREYGRYLWGPYGFYDAYNPTLNWVSPIYMGLNQGPSVVMIENYRTGKIWELFMSHPDVKAGLEKLNAIK